MSENKKKEKRKSERGERKMKGEKRRG